MRFLEDLRPVEIEVDGEGVDVADGAVDRLEVEYALSGCIAADLELALRTGLPLASLDEDLNRAARAAGAELVRP